MRGWQKGLLLVFLLLGLFLCGLGFFRELEPGFHAIAYLEGKGYSSVRITGNLPEGIGCAPEDGYRFTFDAIPTEGKGRVDGWVCGDGEAAWYQAK